MALYYELPVFKATYDLCRDIYLYTKDYPREYKYTLGQEMKQDCMQLLRQIYRANRAKAKKDDLDEFMDTFETLKMQLRLSADMDILSLKRQAQLARDMDKIGRQITGWSKASS
ncbi:MAG: four helix bundle protein [Candidatus Saccharimonadales bacterium]